MGEKTMIDNRLYQIPDAFLPLYHKYIEPYGRRFWDQGVWPAFCDLLDLLSYEGNCPSVVTKKYANETAKALSTVTLLSHSLNVTENLANLYKKYYRHDGDFTFFVQQVLIAGLGHDLGKIPKFITTWQSRFRHPQVSAEVILNLLEKHRADPPWKERVLYAIRQHHAAVGNNRLTEWLSKADSDARRCELWKATRVNLI